MLLVGLLHYPLEIPCTFVACYDLDGLVLEQLIIVRMMIDHYG